MNNGLKLNLLVGRSADEQKAADLAEVLDRTARIPRRAELVRQLDLAADVMTENCETLEALSRQAATEWRVR